MDRVLLLQWFITIGMIFLIHTNAREYKWRDLTEQELNEWYTPTDLCVLNSTEKFTFPQDTRKNECFHVSRGDRRIHCNVGMGNNNKPCFGPFNEARPHFKRGIDGFTDRHSKPLMKAFRYFADTNTTLILLGDSTTRQKLQLLDCQIHLEDPRIKTYGNIWGILPCHTKYTIILPDKRSIYIRIISMGPNSSNCLKGGLGKLSPALGAYENAAYYIDKENNILNKSVYVIANIGLWYNDEIEYYNTVKPVLKWLQTVANMSYISNLNFQNINISTIEDEKLDTTMLLLNNHKSSEQNSIYNKQKQQEYNNNNNNNNNNNYIHSVYNHSKIYKLKNTVVWHETFSQHWINPWNTGNFAKPSLEEQNQIFKLYEGNYSSIPTKEYATPFGCKPITNTSYMADWRNDIIKDLLKNPKNGYGDIHLFPIADITRLVYIYIVCVCVYSVCIVVVYV